ncbi:MAG TPA: hypothetical protein VNN73_00055, partial [Blastocatellia bacterium]|nr:hypothetical protein [Blastocatellia bacterium]
MIKLRGLFLLILIGAFLFSVSFTKAVNGNNNVAASTTVQSDVITVRQGDDLQAAIDRAKPGDVIALEAGATFAGNFTLPNKQGRSDFITIRPAASDELLPSEDARVTPAYAAAMPKIISPNADPALRADAGAHHFRLVGLEITIAPDVMLNYGIVVLGEGRETDLAALPHDVVIDRCYIHGHKTADVARGVALNSATTEIINSYISEIHGIGFDTQAIAGWNGPGPFKIVNNYLEAAGENVMFGGADPKITDLVPADIEFRRNYCFKPLEWKEGILAKPADVATVALFNPASSLMPGATYYYRITARGRAGASVIATSAAADEIAVTLAPELNGVSITWSPVAGATEYRVFRTSDPPIAETRNWVFYTTSANVFDDTGDALSAQSGAPPAVGTRWSVKNLFELKNARRVLIDANLFENNWVDGQSGFAILFTVRNQDGTAP